MRPSMMALCLAFALSPAVAVTPRDDAPEAGAAGRYYSRAEMAARREELLSLIEAEIAPDRARVAATPDVAFDPADP